ncbi:unnamed protein product [Amoebophrya sp. A120]|nr:unnamed protein product [Amoebophrya sp. A120]|eukprot:GSA120T00003915001.1
MPPGRGLRWRKKDDTSSSAQTGKNDETNFTQRNAAQPSSAGSRSSFQPPDRAESAAIGVSIPTEGGGEKNVAIVWHKWSDLRLQDHEPAWHAHRASPRMGNMEDRNNKASTFDAVLHVHLIEHDLLYGRSEQANLPRCSPLRARFWLESVLDLDASLRKAKVVDGGANTCPQFLHVEVVGGDEDDGDAEVSGSLLVTASAAVLSSSSTEQPPLRKQMTPMAREDEEDIIGVKNADRQILPGQRRWRKEKSEAVANWFGEFFLKQRKNVAPPSTAFHLVTHQELCTEEVKTEQAVRASLNALNNAGTVAAAPAGTIRIPFTWRTYWGGQTVHHIQDLGFNPETESDMMPLFKGEFNKMAKKRPIREVLLFSKDSEFRPSLKQFYVDRSAFEDRVHRIFKKALAPDRQVYLQRLLRGRAGGNNKAETDGATAPTSVIGPAAPYTLQNSFEHRWRGGESMAQQYLEDFFKTGDNLWNYCGATESFAHGADHNPIFSGTRFSPWLAFGNVSARMIVKKAYDCEKRFGGFYRPTKGGGKKGKGNSTGKGSAGKTSGSTAQRLHTELLFRDFLRFSAYFLWKKKLFCLEGPMGLEKADIFWRARAKPETQELFRKWQVGETGFPFVDAGMRELLKTGYLSHLHRQCCASFLVRDLEIDWRFGAEHFEATLIDYTPDANWGNWAYRILPRPCLAATRRKFKEQSKKREARSRSSSSSADDQNFVPHLSTLECVVWPIVHDPELEHTLFWVPELKRILEKFGPDCAREPWTIGAKGGETIVQIRPYRDSPLWFCAANRSNWDYEYFWLRNAVGTVDYSGKQGGNKKLNSSTSRNDEEIYHLPLIPPVSVTVDLRKLPVQRFVWERTV